MAYVFKLLDSPVGMLKLVASERGLVAVLWPHDNPARVPLPTLTDASTTDPILQQAEWELGEYFAGSRKTFSIPLDFVGTEFQKQVWKALVEIPYGETRSYGHIARQLGNANAVRAVGAANGKNPISIIAPCHRVIGSSGRLTGFAGGLPTKQYLLTLEAEHSGKMLIAGKHQFALSY